jgi:hypothetical protein
MKRMKNRLENHLHGESSETWRPTLISVGICLEIHNVSPAGPQTLVDSRSPVSHDN